MIVFLFILLTILVLFIAIISTANIKIIIQNIRIENIDLALKILNILIYEKDDKLKLDFLDYFKFNLKIKLLVF